MLTALADVARRTEYPVTEVDGWQGRGHGEMTGVAGVTIHHTANGGARGNAPSLNTVTHGRPGLSGPLAQYVVGMDGTIYVVAAGLCYHAGMSIGLKFENMWRIGIEAEAVGIPGYPGDWPAVQMRSLIALTAELVKHYDLNVSDVLGHKETCRPPGRKTDPSFDMAAFRRVIADHLTEEPDMQPDDKHTLTTSDVAALGTGTAGKTDAEWSSLWRFPPATARLRREMHAELLELKTELTVLQGTVDKQGRVLADILALLQKP